MNGASERRDLRLLFGSAVALAILRIATWLWQRELAARLRDIGDPGEATPIYTLMSLGSAAEGIGIAAAFTVAAAAVLRLDRRAGRIAGGALGVAVASLIAGWIGPALSSAARWAALSRVVGGTELVATAVAIPALLAAVHAAAGRRGQRLAVGASAGAGALVILSVVLPLGVTLAPEAAASFFDGRARPWLLVSFLASVGAYALVAWQVRSALRGCGPDEAGEPAPLAHAPTWEHTVSGLRVVAAAITARVLLAIVSLSVLSLGTMAQSFVSLRVSALTLAAGGALTAAALAVGAVRMARLSEPRDAASTARAAALLFAAVAAAELYGAIEIARRITGGRSPVVDDLIACDTSLQVVALLGVLLVAIAAARLGERLGDAELARRCHRLLAPLAVVFGAAALMRVALFFEVSTPLRTPSTLLLGFAVVATASMALAAALARHLRFTACSIDRRLAGGAVPEARATITEDRA